MITPKIEAISEGLFIPHLLRLHGHPHQRLRPAVLQPVDLVLTSIPIDVVLFLGLLMAVMASKYVITYVSTTLIGEYKPKEIHKMALTMMPMGEYTLVIGQIGLTMIYHGEARSSTPSSIPSWRWSCLTISVIAPMMLRKAYES